ncbi:hypothetical protein SteCoe_38138 [Stentor coeruleus]|uniref:RRM domain-containing protein n=1 Tax=Stentor coeruleus TaxID=5963 RepID=A0A1R2AM44_9CILI|nr:hypothetical protein SteCoe_38138 [Stentor coeruleus]
MVKNKFIAFVGNLPYETTEEELKEFFKGLGELEIRMRYSKEGKSKGFCFVECKDNGQFQKLLKMHHLKLNGRKINIELSAGGGGNSKARKDKIIKKNEKITKFRQSLHENMVKKRPDPSSEKFKKRSYTPSNPQHYL